MKYIKYLKHLVANYPISSLFFSLFIILFFWALFYYRKSIINIVANNFPHSKTKTKIMYVAIFGSFVVSFLYFTNYISNPFKSENCSISKSNYLFGIDVSHHNGYINWNEVKKSKHPIKYVIIKATEGQKFVDWRFHYNWEKAEKKGFIKGAYHFYRPDVNSKKQFNLFSKTVKLEKGDLFPVLDIETESKLGRDNLIKGIRNWVDLCEKKYGVKPIIYTGRKFYRNYLEDEFDDCPLWIASYSSEESVSGLEWDLHQFTEKVIVKGIPESVDGNNFKGDLVKLKENYCIK